MNVLNSKKEELDDDLIDEVEDELEADLYELLEAEDVDLNIAPTVALFETTELSRYFQDIESYPRISNEEEVELAELIAAGKAAKSILNDTNQNELLPIIQAGQAARERFINANYRLVIAIAKPYRASCTASVTFLDLIQSGNLGLMKAVDRFDHTKGLKFSTYATWWIRQHIGRDISNNAQLIRFPVHILEWLSKIYTIEQSEKLSNEELAERLNITVRKVEQLLHLKDTRSIVYLDREVHNLDTNFTSMLEMMPSPNMSPELIQKLNAREDGVYQLLSSRLTDREQYVITRRYGLVDEPLSLSALGKEFNLSRERIRQIESKAMKKLKLPHVQQAFRDLLTLK